MELTFDEGRVLGCLIEKASTTPDAYPLTTNSLVNACNQKTSRDPVVELSDRQVDAAMLELRQNGLARSVRGTGRAVKHRHVADEGLGLNQDELAVLAVLLLRGPQTVGELRSRSERIYPFEDLDEVEAVLEKLGGGMEPLVRELARQPGQKDTRFEQLLVEGESESAVVADGAAQRASSSPPARSDAAIGDVETLRADLADLRRRFDDLCERLGEQID
ncbi:MAG: YceH family protein [Acidimicrobiales bacterium]